MGKADWGVDPEFFGPRHAHRENRIIRRLAADVQPGLHLECAAGVGSLSLSLAERGHTVVAVDSSLRSLAAAFERARRAGRGNRVHPVVADITNLPFKSSVFPTATSAETLEHIEADGAAVAEMARVLFTGGWLLGTVPAGKTQWSEWDDWAGHIRRYSPNQMKSLLEGAGFEPEVTMWGWPTLRLYDTVFLRRVNRRRLQEPGSIEEDSSLRRIARLGEQRWLVGVTRALFSLDRLFDGCRWGVGILFAAQKKG